MLKFLAIQKLIMFRGAGWINSLMLAVITSISLQGWLSDKGIHMGVALPFVVITILVWIVGYIDYKYIFRPESECIWDHMRGKDD
jgi:CBS domain containing-hemolysin-like protein